jgi:ssRNA-specific RNase YbeY (16S rRNA maturation enzyme)
MINIFCSARYKLNKKKIKEHAQTVLERYPETTGAVLNIAFIGKRKMKEIATQYKDEPVALPVLSFAYKKEDGGEEMDNLIGEVVLCYPQAVLLAAEREKKVDEMFNQLIEHGIQNIFMK